MRFLVGKFLDLCIWIYRSIGNSRPVKWLSRHWIVTMMVLVCLILGVRYLLPMRMAVVFMRSIQYSVVFWAEDKEAWRTSEYVLARWTGGDPFSQGLEEGMVLIKRVGCRPGQLLKAAEARFFCDGVPMGTAWEARSKDVLMIPFSFEGKVPEGKLWLIGDIMGSYDGRYFGFINTDQVFGKVWFGI